jgi:hypothetical protein
MRKFLMKKEKKKGAINGFLLYNLILKHFFSFKYAIILYTFLGKSCDKKL